MFDRNAATACAETSPFPAAAGEPGRQALMRRRALRSKLQAATALCALACAGCAPIPVQRYVPDPASGTTVYSSCVFNTHIPIGVQVEAAGVTAIVSLARRDQREFVELRLDVPEGSTLALQEGAVQVETREPNTLSRAEFPLVSLVDNPIVNNFSTVPGVSEQHVPITTALVGERVVIGGASYPRHFWLATYVESASAQDVWLTLPRFTVNGVATSPPRVHFRRRTVLAVAVFNC